jgi:dTDP-4-dehydrorhamnose reductase
MLRLGKERDRLGIVSDQHGCPTSARSIASVLLEIARRHLRGESIEWGTYHFCNQPAASWYEFALRIFERADGYDQLEVDAITTAEYPTPAARPLNSVLDCGRLQNLFGIDIPGWQDELDRVLAELGAR